MSVSESSRSSGSESETGNETKRERKHAALLPPISSLCSALGGFEEFANAQGEIVLEYSLGDQVVGCLKDLKRFWKLDDNDDDRTVARIFHQVGLLKNDLVPILLSTLGTSQKGDRIALACAELIGAMTWPINVASELTAAQAEDKLEKSTDYTSLLAAQLSYKATILQTGALRPLLRLMTPSLEKTRRDRTEKDENIISLILHIFRNLAGLRDGSAGRSASAESIEQSTLQSMYINQLASEHIFDLLLAIASNAETTEFGPWNMVALDIFHLIFRCVKPEELIIPLEQIDEERLENLLLQEGKQKRDTARRGTTRHSRFGTTISLQAGDRKYVVHKQSAVTTEGAAQKTMDSIKNGKAKRVRVNDDLVLDANLRPEAIKCLHEVAISFIDNCFNPFFSSILRDIKMERAKVQATDTLRFLFLTRFFLEFFLLLRVDEEKRGVLIVNGEMVHDFDLVAVMTAPSSIAFVTAVMKSTLDLKSPDWTVVHAAVDCFTQVLLIIDSLMLSGIEENVDVAEILQNKLYYEGETLGMILNVMSRYTKQSLSYLNSIINLTYTLLRMLEKYSKSTAYMYVRKKKARVGRRKKAKANGTELEVGLGDAEDEEEEEMDRSTLGWKDHSFAFSDFETSFAEETVLRTCMTFLEGWKTFTSPEQLKRIVSLIHRMAIKAKSEGLFYKPTVLELFKQILEDSALIPATPKLKEHADLKSLIEFILKKFFKAVKENPLLLLEVFYPKTRTQLGKMRLGNWDPYASSEDDNRKGGLSKGQLSGDVEVQEGFSLSQQIGIAMACLVDEDRMNLVEFIQQQLSLAAAARTEIVLATDGNPLDALAPNDEEETDESIRTKAAQLNAGPSAGARALFVPYAVDLDNPATRKAASTNVHMRLLMRLLEWEFEEVHESFDLTWSIPPSLLPSALLTLSNIIAGFILDPLNPSSGKSAKDLLQKQKKIKIPRQKRNLRTVRRMVDGVEIVEEVVVRRKSKSTKKVENTAFKSAQFIVDSDDETSAERDAMFFAAEAALRGKITAGEISAHIDGKQAKLSNAKSKAATKKKGKSRAQDSEESAVDSDATGGEEEERPKKKKQKRIKEKTIATVVPPSPLSSTGELSPPPASQNVSSPPPPTTTFQRNRAVATDSDDEQMGGIEEVEEEISSAPRRRPIIVDSEED